MDHGHLPVAAGSRSSIVAPAQNGMPSGTTSSAGSTFPAFGRLSAKRVASSVRPDWLRGARVVLRSKRRMSITARTWTRVTVSFAVVLSVVVGLTGGRSVAATPRQHAAIVGAGVLAGRPWRVAVGSQGRNRKGVCLQTLFGLGEGILCAAPARRRGMVTADQDGRAPHGRARITVIAAALNRTVGTLRLVRDDGRVMNLHTRPIRARRADAHIKNFRYLAKAVRGSICAKRMETIGIEGRVLWQVPEGELERMRLVCKPGT